MPDEKDTDYEYIEVKVSKKIEIRLSPQELLALAQSQAGAVASTVLEAPGKAVEGAGRVAQLGQWLKGAFLGRGAPKDN
ncbi:MAG TPA: hypothetical protein VL996_01065 [Methylocella sp.]|nr:hypothetical protein [Methylocella sp.]